MPTAPCSTHAWRVEPNVVVYNAALNACDKSGRPEQALALLDEIKSSGSVEVPTYL